MATAQIAPPAGFVLDPPSGFVLDDPAPPDGFVLDNSNTLTDENVASIQKEGEFERASRGLKPFGLGPGPLTGEEPELELPRQLHEATTKPLLNLALNPREFAESARTFTGAALSTPGNKTELGTVSDEMLEGRGFRTAYGIYKSIADTESFFTSPLGIATLGIGSLPAAAQRAVAGAFAVQMASATPELARELGTELGKPDSERDYGKISELTTTAITTLGFTSMAGKHALAPKAKTPLEIKADEIAPVAPLTAEALKSVEKPKGVEDAPKIEIPVEEAKPTEVLETAKPQEAVAEVAKVESPADRVTEAPTTTTFDPSQVATVEVPIESLKLSKDVPQFKAEAVEETGVVPGQELQGKFERVGTAPIVVWERLSGAKEIITGRHRFDLAKRSGEKTIPAQIVKESEGFTRDQALILDAFSNIRDGMGSIDDYVTFFKGSSISEAEARAGGLLSRVKGRTAWNVAQNASPDLYAIYRSGKVSAEQAAAIAEAAPGDANLQRVATSAALRGEKPATLTNLIRVARMETGGKADQLDLLGGNDSAIKNMEEMAARATSEQQEIAEQIRAVQGAAKRPEAAKKLGVDVSDPGGVLKKVGELKGELIRWQNWPLHPDLVARVKGSKESSFSLGEPETIEQQKARVSQEAAAAEAKAFQEKQKADVAAKAQQRLGGDLGSAGQGGLFAEVGQQEIFKPKPIGMGGAVPSEFEASPKTATSIKNAQVDAERQQRGLPPAIQPARRSFGTVWDEAMAKIDNDPGYPDRLISELREKPRALTDAEDATLLHRQIDLQNEYGKSTRDLAQAFDDGRTLDVQAEQARVAAVGDMLFDIYEVGKKAGTETGRGLNARKMMAYEDFTLAKMELEKRAAKGGEKLTTDERTEVTRLHDEIQRTKKAYDDYVATTEAKLAEIEVKRALDEVEREAKKEPVYSPEVLSAAERIVRVFEKRADAATIRLKEKLSRFSAGVDPSIIVDLAEIGVAKLGRAALDFTRWVSVMREQLGEHAEKAEPFFKEAFEASKNLLESDLARMKVGEKVKRAIKGGDLDAQIEGTSNAIRERIEKGERGDITPLVQRLARFFVSKGITERDPLIDAVHARLTKIDPTFTRRETMDAISGYGDFKQLTKDEISVKLRDLKGQMQQVAKLEDMQAGQPPLKTGVERRIPSAEESRLIKLVNDAKNQFQIPITDEATQLKSSLDTLKARMRGQMAEWEGRLERKDFQKKPRRIVQLDEEANRLSFAHAKARIRWHEALMKDRLARRSLPRKILDTGREAINLVRAVMTSLDLSAVLRQGGFIALGHPIRALKSFPAMLKAFASEANQHAVNQEIAARKNFPLYNQSKLYLSEHGQKLSQMEEAYMSRWADKIPLVAGSQRAYVTFLNKLRADSFDAMADALARGKEITPAEGNAIANYINVATGRGNLGMKENALVGLNTVFFAPRYVASRFQLLVGQPFVRGSARTRVLIAAEYGRYLTGVAIVYALAVMDGADIETDPRSSDFGKLRYGKTRIDPLSGLQQVTVLTSRLATGETKNLRGKVIPIRGEKVPFGAGNSADVMARFLRSKLAPVPGAIVNILAGKNVVGEPVTAQSTAADLTMPLALGDIYKVMREHGVDRGTAFSILSIFGMGLQTYDDKKKKAN